MNYETKKSVGVRLVNESSRFENENSIQIDFINLDQTLGSLIPVVIDYLLKPSIIWGKVPGVIQSPVCKKA